MEQSNNRYFEISDSGNYVRIEPINRIHYNSQHISDENWINTKIVVKAGVFNGEYLSYIMTSDFEHFKHELKNLYNNLSGTALFCPLEEQLKLSIKGDGIGHFNVDCKAQDQAGVGNLLLFDLNFDQTMIPTLISQLEIITEAFPIIQDAV